MYALDLLDTLCQENKIKVIGEIAYANRGIIRCYATNHYGIKSNIEDVISWVLLHILSRARQFEPEKHNFEAWLWNHIKWGILDYIDHEHAYTAKLAYVADTPAQEPKLAPATSGTDNISSIIVTFLRRRYPPETVIMFCMYYGIWGWAPHSYAEVGKAWGMSKQAVWKKLKPVKRFLVTNTQIKQLYRDIICN